jgi:HK97 gp10 family phage protein
MADGVTFSIPDLQAFLRELDEVSEMVRKRILKGAVASGASVVRREAILRAPLYTGPISAGHPPPGTLKRSIYQTRLVDKCTRNLEVWKVDVRRGKRTTKKGAALPDAFYAAWVEYGHYTRRPKSAGRRRRGEVLDPVFFQAPKPFMRPAFETKKGEALQAIAQYIRDNLGPALAAQKFIKAAA